jgi:hypothetical protein
MSHEQRIPVYLDPATIPPSAAPLAWLVEQGAESGAPVMERFALSAAHAPGCGCCAPRGPAAQALARLFLRRARGEVAPFSALAVRTQSSAGREAVQAALTSDVLVAARFRPAP